MKRGTPENPKVDQLMERLGVSLCTACGLLELLWHFAAAYAKTGDISKFSNRAIAKKVGWDGDPDNLVRSLIDTRWLDEHPVGASRTLLVHDWPEHCDDAVHMALARAHQFFADGTPPKLCRFYGRERDELTRFYDEAHGAHTVCTPCGHCLSQAPPSPAKPRQAPPSQVSALRAATSADGNKAGEGQKAVEAAAEVRKGEEKPDAAPADSALKRSLEHAGITGSLLADCLKVEDLTPVAVLLELESVKKRNGVKSPAGLLGKIITAPGYHAPKTIPPDKVAALANARKLESICGHKPNPDVRVTHSAGAVMLVDENGDAQKIAMGKLRAAEMTVRLEGPDG